MLVVFTDHGATFPPVPHVQDPTSDTPSTALPTPLLEEPLVRQPVHVDSIMRDWQAPATRWCSRSAVPSVKAKPTERILFE